MNRTSAKHISVSPLKSIKKVLNFLSPKSKTTRQANSSTPNTPKSRKTVRFFTSPANILKTSTSFTQKSLASNSRSPLNKSKHFTKKNSPVQDYKIFIPSHLEVIKRLKNLSNINKPFPFTKEIPEIYIPFSKENSQAKKNKEILESIAKDPLLNNSKYFDQFLFRVKETERILRQESEFIKKVRQMKPGIKLYSEKNEKKNVKNNNFKKKLKNKTPKSCLRSGIVVKDCYGC